MYLKIPPAIQMLLAIFFMWLINRYLPLNHFEFKAQEFLSWAVFLRAMILIVYAIFGFFKAKTTTDPTKPEKASSLVITGIFKISRNPMYLAMLMVLISFAIKLGNLLSLIGPILFFISMTYLQIKPEEKILAKKFGQAYIDYCKKVRRWI